LLISPDWLIPFNPFKTNIISSLASNNNSPEFATPHLTTGTQLVVFPSFPTTISSLYHSLHPQYSVAFHQLYRGSDNQASNYSSIHCEACHVCVLLLCSVTDYTVHDVSTLKQKTFQVSTYGQNHARNANDGNRQTCAVSEPGTNPWWAVDLEDPTLVFMVKLTNSGGDKGTCHWIILITLC